MARISDQNNSSLETNITQQPSVLNGVDNSQIVDKEDRSKKLNFTYTFSPIYYFSRILGLMPFSFIYDARGELQAPQIRPIDGVWYVFSLCIYVLVAIINIQIAIQKQTELKAISFALYFGHYMLLIKGLLISAISIVMDFYNRYTLVKILQAFIAFDKEVSCNRKY